MTSEAIHPGPADDALPQADDSRSDRSLLRLYRHGSQDAATQLYQRYAIRLRRLTELKKSPDLGRRVDADDIIQSVFGSFFRKARKGIYDVPEGKELWRLFVVITVNKVRAKAKYHRADMRDVGRTTDGLDGCDGLPDSNREACAVLKLAIEEALDRLPDQKRQAIQLRMQGYEVDEIAGRFGRSKRSVERLLQESLERLAKLLED